MKSPGRPIRILAALGIGAALVLGVSAGPSVAAAVPTAPAAQPVREVLLGTWVGTYSGFDGSAYMAGLERFQITAVRGAVAKGSWQYRATDADPWSAKSPLLLVALPDPAGGWKITGADDNGIIIGTLDETGASLDLAYQGSVNGLLAYHFVMRKK